MNNSVIIASTAGFLVDALSNILKEIHMRVYVVNNENDLTDTINNTFPRFILIEHCFRGCDTANYIYKKMMYNQNLNFVIWTAFELSPDNAIRYIHAGAKSFLSLRDTAENVEKTILRISDGQRCYPKDVKEALDNENNDQVYNIPVSEREKDIIKLLGYKDEEIANKLKIKTTTVRYHKDNLARKFGVKRKNKILEFAIKNKIIKNTDLL